MTSARFRSWLLLVTSCLALSSSVTFAQQANTRGFGRLSIETRPYYFFFPQGYNLGLWWNTSSRIDIGIDLAGLELPQSFAASFFEASRTTDDLIVDWDYGASIMLRYRFSSRRSTPFVALNLGFEEWTLSARNGIGPSADYENAFITPRIGYIWQPFRNNGFYISPIVGLIFLSTSTRNERLVGDQTARLRELAPAYDIVIGYTFDW